MANETRKSQRTVNRVIRKFRKSLEADPLFKGRYTIREIEKNRVCYEDGWTQWWWRFDIIDTLLDEHLETNWFGITEFTYVNLAGRPATMPSDLWWEVNNFIVRQEAKVRSRR